MKRKVMALIVGLCLSVPALAGAEVAEVNDPLLKKLVEKGMLSEQEAGDIQSKKVVAPQATELPAALKGLSIGGLVFLDYAAGKQAAAPGGNYNRFTLQRAYINVNKEIAPWFKVRITPDITTSATTAGNYVMRMKYAYADFLPPEIGIGPLTNIDVRAGLAQLPWLDFEEAVNGYRMQSAMFQDKRGLVTSSDVGVGVLGNLGGKLDKEQTANVGSGSYAGRFGSYHVGLYNGGGYSSTTGETNQNKSLQGRLTIRPLPEMLPGLQLTWFGITGQTNTATAGTGKPQGWLNNTAFVSYQQKYATLTAEFFTGRGSNGGDTSYAKRKKGYSYFAKFVLPMYEKVGIFGRYDSLNPDRDAVMAGTTKDNTTNKIKTAIAGLSYRITGENYIVAAYERTHDETVHFEDKKAQAALQLSF